MQAEQGFIAPKPISDDDTDREDSGIHTTDVSCSQSQADEQTDQQLEDLNQIVLKTEPEEVMEEIMEQIDDEASVSESTDGASNSNQSVYEGILTFNIGSSTNPKMVEVNSGLTKEQALTEAKRCLDCANPTCITGCPVNIRILLGHMNALHRCTFSCFHAFTYGVSPLLVSFLIKIFF